MISGTFHTISQEWRYYSREKSLIHTLHLGQLPTGIAGDPVFIPSVPPTGVGGLANNGFKVGTGSVPLITPYRNVTFLGTTGYMISPWFALPGFQPADDVHLGIARIWNIDAQAYGFSNVAETAVWASLSGTCEPQGDPGGMIWLQQNKPLVFSIQFGTVPQPPPESAQAYAFISDIGPTTGPNNVISALTYPPSNFQQLSHDDLIMQEDLNGGNTFWQTNVEVVSMQGGYLQPTDRQMLIDNVSFPHQGVAGKGVGASSWIGLGNLISATRFTNSTNIMGIKFGPMNLLNGPNWMGQ